MLDTVLLRARNLVFYGHYIPVDYFVFDQRRLVYISIPKVACTSLKIALMGGGVHAGNEYSKYMNIHHDVNTMHRPSLPRQASNYFKFAFVRNPFDRLVSFYEDKVRRPTQHNGRYYFDSPYNRTLIKTLFGTCFSPDISFTDFVQLVSRIPDWLADGHFKSQYAMLFRLGRQIPDFIGRFENLEEDWKPLAQNYGLPALKKRNANTLNDWRAYYSDRAVVERVAQRYRKDLAHFGYEREYTELLHSV
jgi:hypothetical protein